MQATREQYIASSCAHRANVKRNVSRPEVLVLASTAPISPSQSWRAHHRRGAERRMARLLQFATRPLLYDHPLGARFMTAMRGSGVCYSRGSGPISILAQYHSGSAAMVGPLPV